MQNLFCSVSADSVKIANMAKCDCNLCEFKLWKCERLNKITYRDGSVGISHDLAKR